MKLVHKILSLNLLVLIMLLSVYPIPVSAAEDRDDCSITLLLGEGEDHTENVLKGGVISLYYVAGIDEAKQEYDISLGQFAEEEELFVLEGITSEELNDLNPDLSMLLAEKAIDEKIPAVQSASIENGKVTFSGLSSGLWLIFQSRGSRGNIVMEPCLISLPDETGSYHVTAAPKSGFGPDPLRPSPSPDNSEDPDPTPEGPIPRVTPGPDSPYGHKDPRIPLTGQLWWPIPVLLMFGIGLIAFGIAVRGKGEDHEA